MMNAARVRRFCVPGVVLAAAIVLLLFSFHAERHLETGTRVEGSQAETVNEELSSRFRINKKLDYRGELRLSVKSLEGGLNPGTERC